MTEKKICCKKSGKKFCSMGCYLEYRKEGGVAEENKTIEGILEKRIVIKCRHIGCDYIDGIDKAVAEIADLFEKKVLERLDKASNGYGCSNPTARYNTVEVCKNTIKSVCEEMKK